MLYDWIHTKKNWNAGATLFPPSGVSLVHLGAKVRAVVSRHVASRKRAHHCISTQTEHHFAFHTHATNRQNYHGNGTAKRNNRKIYQINTAMDSYLKSAYYSNLLVLLSLLATTPVPHFTTVPPYNAPTTNFSGLRLGRLLRCVTGMLYENHRGVRHSCLFDLRWYTRVHI